MLLRTDVLADAQRIYELEDAYHQSPAAFPVTVHVVPLDRVDEGNVPATETLFER